MPDTTVAEFVYMSDSDLKHGKVHISSDGYLKFLYVGKKKYQLEQEILGVFEG